MRKIFFVALLAMAGCSKSDTAGATPSAKAEELPAMTVDEVDKGVTDKSLQAVDCNHPALRKKLGVVPGAILVSGADKYAESELPADKNAKLVFYCADPG